MTVYTPDTAPVASTWDYDTAAIALPPEPPDAEPQVGDFVLICLPNHALPVKARVLDVTGWGARLFIEYWTLVYMPGIAQPHGAAWRQWVRCTDVLGKA